MSQLSGKEMDMFQRSLQSLCVLRLGANPDILALVGLPGLV